MEIRIYLDTKINKWILAIDDTQDGFPVEIQKQFDSFEDIITYMTGGKMVIIDWVYRDPKEVLNVIKYPKRLQ